MNLGYDIFKKLEDGSPMWVMQVATIEEARKNLASLLSKTPAEYFIRDASTGLVIVNPGPSPAI
jgi:hypothetical protein